jgi:hypothetical protein
LSINLLASGFLLRGSMASIPSNFDTHPMTKSILCIPATIASLLITCSVTVADQPKTETGFVSMFDGKSMDGWKVTEENPDAWTVEDGKLKCAGKRSHLFYVGDGVPFKNFHFKSEVMTTPGSNAGIYFHTKYQKSGWPKAGFECQVNVSHGDPKKTGSLYDVINVADPGVQDNEWYTQEIIVKDKNVKLIVNGKTLVDYTEQEGQKPHDRTFARLIDEGTFALQAHDPKSVAYFRNLRVKKLD